MFDCALRFSAFQSRNTRGLGRVRSHLLLGALLLTGGLLLSTHALPAFAADTAQAHFDLGVKNYNSNKMEDALAEFQKAHELSPKEPTSLFWIGFIYLQQRHYQEALKPTLDAVELRPNMADGHLNLGNIYDGLKRYPDAVKEFETAIKLEPKMPRLADAYYNLGSLDLKMDRKTEALTAFQRAAILAPTDAYVQDGLGYARQITGDYAAAIPSHQAATRLMPTNASFWLNLGLAQQSAARKQLASKSGADRAAGQVLMMQAQASLAQAQKLAPEDYTICATYGETLYEMKRDEDASAQFTKAAQLRPTEYKPLYNLALAQSRLKHYEAAEEAYNGVLKIDPNNIGALQGLGATQYNRKQYADAAQTFQKLTALKPESASAWADYSLSLENAGKSDEAAGVLEEALTHVGTGPASAPLRLTLGVHLFKKGDAASMTRARELFAQVAQSSPTNADAYNGLGLVAQKEHNYDEAITNFTKATSLNPKFADAFNNLGVAYEAKGNLPQAIAACRKATQIDPNNLLAKDNLTRMTTKGAAPPK